MKKKSLLLLLPLLVGCGIPSQPVTLDLASTLEAFKLGIKVDVTLNETNNSEAKTQYFKNTSKEKEFSLIQYSDETKTTEVIHEYYVSLPGEDEIFATRLDVSNEYNLYEVYNPYTYEYYTWDDGYNNAFLKLTSEDFTEANRLTYKLNEDKTSLVSNEISTLIYGNPGLTLTSLTISKEEETISLYGGFTYEETYTYTFTAKVLESGEETEADPRLKPFEEVQDTAFSTMLEALKGNNYTTTVENYEDGILDYTSTCYTEETAVLFETDEATFGYYEVEGLCQEAYKDGEVFYKSGEPVEGSLDELRATFNLSASCFDLVDDLYRLKDGVEGSIYAVTLLESYADELDEFTLEIKSDSYVFTNTLGDYKTVVTISNIGTTDTGLSEETVLEPIAGLSWLDVLGEEYFGYIYEIAGDAAYNLPVPEGYTEWACEYVEDELTFALLMAEGKSTLEDDIYLYALELLECGYVLYEEPGFIAEGAMLLAAVEVGGEEHVLAVELINYYGAFAIALYIAE